MICDSQLCVILILNCEWLVCFIIFSLFYFYLSQNNIIGKGEESNGNRITLKVDCVDQRKRKRNHFEGKCIYLLLIHGAGQS